MDIGVLLLRLTVGLTLGAHGAQKLFGWFGGPGLDGTAKGMEMLGFFPGRRHALMAGLTEVGGGLLLAPGLMTPVAASIVFAVMLVAGAGEPVIDTEPTRTRADQQNKKEHVQDFLKVEEMVEPAKSGPRDVIATRHTRNGRHVQRPSLFHLRSREHPGTEAEPKVVRICPFKSVARGVLRQRHW
jgi:DoxX